MLKNIAYSSETITFYDYIHTETFAEKTIINNEWVWRKI